jgi:histidine triad (HIT) family protein
MTRSNDCIFCSIVAGDAPAHRVYEDERVLIFMDLFPAHAGHTLIIPKRHGENLFEVAPEDLDAVIRQSKALAEALRTVLEPDGIAVIQLNGAAAGQTVFHYHMHLIPRMEGEPFGVHGKKRGDDDALTDHAARLAAAFTPAD